MDIKLTPPIENFSWKHNISQFFGVSHDTYMTRFGVPGHNGLDIVIRDNKRGFGTPVLAMHDGTIERINYDVPHKTSGNGIYLLSTDKTFSTNYWHLASFEAEVGQEIKQGQVIATVGNSGWVFPKPSPTCIHCGTHLHIAVKRHSYRNDYGGFIDPVPCLFREGDKLPMNLRRNMFLLSNGDHVSHLQTLLHIEGFGGDYERYGHFGRKTLRDAIALQRRHGISPTLGYVYTKTRAFLNEKYSLYA